MQLGTGFPCKFNVFTKLHMRHELHTLGQLMPHPEGSNPELPLRLLPVIDAGDSRSEWVLLTVLGLAVLLLGLAYVKLLARRRQQELGSELVGMNQAIAQQQAEIEAQNQAIQAINNELVATLNQVNQQRAALDRQQARLAESIHYASRIQQTILPDAEQLALWPEHFIAYQPLTEVSGDFYWSDWRGEELLLGVVACRSRHLPGAFLSVLACSLMHQLVSEAQAQPLNELLTALDRRLRSTLHDRQAASSLGVALLSVGPTDLENRRTIAFAGAGLPLIRQLGPSLERLLSSPSPCGGVSDPIDLPPLIEWKTTPGERLYLLTDAALAAWSQPPVEYELAAATQLPFTETGQFFRQVIDRLGHEPHNTDLLIVGLHV
jgi:hypothetical protein